VVRTSILLNDEPNAAAGTDRLFGEFAGRGGAAKAIDNIADCYRESARYEEARKLYKRAVATWPTSRYAMESQKGYVLCSIALTDDPNAAAGTSEMLRSFANNADLATGLYDVAAGYEKAACYEKAKNTYSRVVEIFPGSVAASKAELDIAKTDIMSLIDIVDDSTVQEEIEFLFEHFNGDSYLPKAVFGVAREYGVRAFLGTREGLARERGDYARAALPFLDKVITNFPDDAVVPEALEWAGDCHRLLGEYEQAISFYERTLDDWPKHEYAARAQFLIGHVYEKMKREGLIDEADADGKIWSAYKRVVTKYQGSVFVKAAQDWLACHKNDN